MKIEAKDLRIGNWVNYKGTPIPVTMLGEFGIQSKLEYSTINAKFYTTDLSGIPLTPEILEKAGFQYHYLSPTQHYFHSPMIVINTYKTKDAFYYESQLCDVELKFVHQIQNLYFALTGQELNIEL